MHQLGSLEVKGCVCKPLQHQTTNLKHLKSCNLKGSVMWGFCVRMKCSVHSVLVFSFLHRSGFRVVNVIWELPCPIQGFPLEQVVLLFPASGHHA